MVYTNQLKSAASVALASIALSSSSHSGFYGSSFQKCLSSSIPISQYSANNDINTININITTSAYNNCKVCEGEIDMSKNSNLLFEKNIAKLNEMLNLGDDWDGEGALAFDKELIENAKELLTSLTILQPNIFPTADSRIQLEFYNKNNYLEFVISRSGCELYITDSINLDSDIFDEFEYCKDKVVSIVKKFYNNTWYKGEFSQDDNKTI